MSERIEHAWFEHTAAKVAGAPVTVSRTGSTLFEGVPAQHSVWMSHGDACSAAPEGR